MIPYLLIPAAFLMGSIPFGFLIARAKGIDLRKHGSGNIGATNLGRVLGRPYFFLCFALDLTKGLTPTLIAGSILGTLGRMDIQPADAWIWLAVMFAAPLGHIFCPWLGFKGGKGVATAMGAMIGVMPAMTIPAAGAFIVYMVVLLLWRMVGPASSLAAASLPLWTWYAFAQYETLQERRIGSQSQFAETSAGDIDQMVPNFGLPFFLVALALAIMVIYKHKANLLRALAGTEPKLGESKPLQNAHQADESSSDSAEPSA
jgi:acyl phosphate:glycerol-3-phosphate acyltransferase